MSLRIAGHQAQSYVVNTTLYAGPLDLLLELIEKAELDITRLALAQVTDQYLAYLEQLQERDPAEVSAFLVIAARLIQVKSEALLPRPPARAPGEEDPGEALAQQLILYKKFKTIGQWLASRDAAGLRTYLRLAAPPRAEARLDTTGLTLTDLILAAQAAFFDAAPAPVLSDVVSIPLLTIRNRMRSILAGLREREVLSFRTLAAGSASRVDIVVTFLALLELVKRRLVEASQPELFADIQFQLAAGAAQVDPNTLTLDSDEPAEG